ncbi:hypothetical protein ACQCSX_19030 [Pseudarthrobacter sp. P1]
MHSGTNFRQRDANREVRQRRNRVISYVALFMLAIVSFSLAGYALMK